MKLPDVEKHVRGESLFIDDFPLPESTLFALPVYSTCAHGKITSADFDEVKKSDGVIAVLTHADIDGMKSISLANRWHLLLLRIWHMQRRHGIKQKLNMRICL
jgi:xanthine dehydrogenase large subunit